MSEEPGEGTGSDQIRLASALKFKVVSACDGKGLFSPFLGVACGEQGLGTPSRKNRYRRGWTVVGSSLRSQSRVMEGLMSSLRHCPLAVGTITGIS